MIHIVHEKDWLVTALLEREVLRNRSKISFGGSVEAVEDIGCWPPETAIRRCKKLTQPFSCRFTDGERARIVGIYFMLPSKRSNSKWLGNIYFAHTINRQKKVRLSAWACFPFESLVNFYEERVWKNI